MRRLSNAVLAGLVALSTGALLYLAVTSLQGDVIGGWSLEPEQLHIGFTRMMCFFCGAAILPGLAAQRTQRLWVEQPPDGGEAGHSPYR